MNETSDFQGSSRRPSRQMSISNLKRSLSKSSSISSLKSILKGSSNGEDSAGQKRRKPTLFNDLSLKKIKLFKRSSNNNTQEPKVVKATKETSNIPRKQQQNNASSSSSSSSSSSYYHSHQNLNKLDNKVLNNSSLRRNGLKTFAKINEEPIDDTANFIPPSKTVFNFSPGCVSAPNDKKRHTLVTSKGYYNLSQIIKESKQSDIEEGETTMVDLSFMLKSYHVPNSRSVATMNNSYANDGDTLVEDVSHPNILDDLNVSNEQTESYLDFFNNTIEPIHNQNKKEFINNYFNNIQSRTFDPSVQQITKKLSATKISPTNKPQMSILELPEILERILLFVENDIVLPVEQAPIRRKPLSYEHAKLIYKDETTARTVWKNVLNRQNSDKLNQLALSNYLKHENGVNPKMFKSKFYANNVLNQSIKNFQNIKIINKTIYNCLFVNKMWNSIAKKLIFKKLFFNNDANFQKLITKIKNDDTNIEFKNAFKNASSNVLLMHKLKNVTQDQINLLANYVIANGNKLEWIEMYICPEISPPLSLFTSNALSHNGPSMLKKLVLAGSNSRKINNFFLKIVANNCPNLEKIDLRSCEHFSDTGLIEISLQCKKLSYLNIGRYNNRDKITDASICSIIRNVECLKTLGCAGCYITDNTIWNLVNYQNTNINKLSLNNCVKLTNASIPRILEQHYFPNLQVLEIRNITNITDFKPIINYKKRKLNKGELFLIENCQDLEKRMAAQEFEMNLEISKKMLHDISDWCDDPNDGDIDLPSFISRKQYEIALANDQNANKNNDHNNNHNHAHDTIIC